MSETAERYYLVVSICIFTVICLLTPPLSYAQNLLADSSSRYGRIPIELPGTYTGPVQTLDGSTLLILGDEHTILRLHAVDARDLKDSLGRSARDRLLELIAGKNVTCKILRRNDIQQLIGVCENHQGKDVGLELIRSGLAFTNRYFIDDEYFNAYEDAESDAIDNERGYWKPLISVPEFLK